MAQGRLRTRDIELQASRCPHLCIRARRTRSAGDFDNGQDDRVISKWRNERSGHLRDFAGGGDFLPRKARPQNQRERHRGSWRHNSVDDRRSEKARPVGTDICDKSGSTTELRPAGQRCVVRV